MQPDAANKEQVVVCLRWVDNALEAHADLIGLYEVESTEASAVLAVIHDVCKRLDIPIAKLRGQCYDGASAMSGSKAGVAKQILDEQPKAIYTHCYGHSLSICGRWLLLPLTSVYYLCARGASRGANNGVHRH